MRALIIAPLLGLSLLGACAQPQYLYSEATTTAPGAVATGHLSLRIGDGFSVAEQAKILAAVDDWNRSSSRPVRLDVVSATANAPAPGGWIIRKPNGAVLGATDVWTAEPAAVTRRNATGGGSIVVDVNRLGRHDLRNLVVQELDIAMGAGNPVPFEARAPG